MAIEHIRITLINIYVPNIVQNLVTVWHEFNRIQERHLEFKMKLRNDQLIHSHVTKYGNNNAKFVYNGRMTLRHKFITSLSYSGHLFLCQQVW